MADTTTEIDLESVIERLLEGESFGWDRCVTRWWSVPLPIIACTVVVVPGRAGFRGAVAAVAHYSRDVAVPGADAIAIIQYEGIAQESPFNYKNTRSSTCAQRRARSLSTSPFCWSSRHPSKYVVRALPVPYSMIR